MAGQRGAAQGSAKHTKESFLKKLGICQKNYDYKDETKDMQGKT